MSRALLFKAASRSRGRHAVRRISAGGCLAFSERDEAALCPEGVVVSVGYEQVVLVVVVMIVLTTSDK